MQNNTLEHALHMSCVATQSVYYSEFVAWKWPKQPFPPSTVGLCNALALYVPFFSHNLQLIDLTAQTASDMAALLASREWELSFQINAALHKLAWAEGVEKYFGSTLFIIWPLKPDQML